MTDFINAHCHLLTFKFVPDSFFKSRAPIREWLLRRYLTSFAARIATVVLPGNNYDRSHQVLWLLRQNIDRVAEAFVAEMRESGIILATPLMMDFEFAYSKQKSDIDYENQVEKISQACLKYPGELMPFIMFDPRRPGAIALTVNALENLGFLGVKLYPSLGYHPDPDNPYNSKEVNKALNDLYDYCEAENIPITVHCSKGGAYNKAILQSEELCHPANWEPVLKKHPELRLNLAHFGSDEALLDHENALSWANQILKLMKNFANVYADTSYHTKALEKKTKEQYFKVLAELMEDETVAERIIFGTDWLMTRHTWTEGDFCRACDKLSESSRQQIAFNNPLRFLFAEGKLPERIKKFYQANQIKPENLPMWLSVFLA
ncbi:hypothetical protein A2291_04345 [candidate division WOR-1 bacterium RIFOXYB2_FULL_42_35]|uniref:Amidohydrolase-related domain-containing protein n=1 Tax=candidate division WOR-1 bacterium RIFOXYC2_FULL_41_25 TaxID=1802586 RepID=A0A1F4TR81_UNCSA|nr:MAG: hypothetical protein A2247_07460 [candidate division WOR-1 bacterium RIFOXYA2_FULL_41_14]OGC25794.1 MAG: hypothetical protein A2291_04345 [candidate division WOR-1 bacterium RIFOXYB2_FULL_42_35]OGC35234.1 MAG: hypothetical protein A2462_08335 [candidate division WOR-1 bacterium RIFOXYC2_FULL_41_25]OGC42751.1 MAG: hypothetical protein A2548_00235 [candidate division WOR-1 bacterium RIFOXYD2_FULL_41_8]